MASSSGTQARHRSEEARAYRASAGSHANGRSTIWITCPFCGTETECFLWSLAGSGKRCTCGAKHHYLNAVTTRTVPEA